MNLFIRNIKALVGISDSSELKKGTEMADIQSIENAWLCISNGKIEDFGKMSELNEKHPHHEHIKIIEADGQIVMPGFVDSHTHIVYAASRESEFVDRIRGMSYEEIAKRGGGILNSARRLQETPEDDLFHSALNRLHSVIKKGTVAIEIKSGYGLTVQDELKMLKVIKRLKEVSPIPIKSTFLGAHAFPINFREDRQGYIKQIIDSMLPEIADQGLADYCDVFCDKGFFSVEECSQIQAAFQDLIRLHEFLLLNYIFLLR